MRAEGKPGYYWVHNDSGGGPYLYLVHLRGSVVTQLEVTDAEARDWEAAIVVLRRGEELDAAADRLAVLASDRAVAGAEVREDAVAEEGGDMAAMLVNGVTGPLEIAVEHPGQDGRLEALAHRGVTDEIGEERGHDLALRGGFGFCAGAPCDEALHDARGRQPRAGLNGRTFQMLKFRSMRLDAERTTGPVWAVRGDDRCTPLGRLLRRWSLDELPQLLNVLKGDMSLVGPRPERGVFVEQFRRQIPNYAQRHQVKAGITGWAQVNGWRGNTSLRRRVECDLYYICNWSLWLDLKILLLTPLRGIWHRNAM